MHSLGRVRSCCVCAVSVQAGAAEGEFYTPAAIMAREVAREDPEVQQALTAAWVACLDAAGADGTVGVDGSSGKRGLTKGGYDMMTRKLYLAGVLSSVDLRSGEGWSLDAIECEAACEAGWAEDCEEGSEVLCEGAFLKAWWELCDLYTASVRPDDYTRWLRQTVSRITRIDDRPGGTGGAAVWRSDREQLDDILCAFELGVSKEIEVFIRPRRQIALFMKAQRT